jgi:hypothetical protein
MRLIDKVLAVIAGPIITRVIGTSYPSIWNAALIPPTMLNRFTELQPAIKTVMLIKVNKNIRKIRSPSKLMIAVKSDIGTKKHASSGKDNIKIGAQLNMNLSAALGRISSLESNLIKSAKG